MGGDDAVANHPKDTTNLPQGNASASASASASSQHTTNYMATSTLPTAATAVPIAIATAAAAAAPTADDTKKSERKRKRERQRRSDLADAFDELSTLVTQMDPDNNNEDHHHRDHDDDATNDGMGMTTTTTTTTGQPFIIPSSTTTQNGMSGTTGNSNKRGSRRKNIDSTDTAATTADVDNSGMTRLDLIGRTTMILRRYQRENIDLRRRLDEYKRGSATGGGGGGAGAGARSTMASGLGGGYNDDTVNIYLQHSLHSCNFVSYDANSIHSPICCVPPFVGSIGDGAHLDTIQHV
jgi:Helix-loop-helix DNA-binding domain